MRPFVLDPSDSSQVFEATASGAIVVEEVKVAGKRLFHKGHRLVSADEEALASVDRSLHALYLDPDDVHEDEAGMRIAQAISGDGIVTRGPVQSRVNLVSERKGLLRVDPAAISALNQVVGIAIFTLIDRLPILPGKIVAGAKITPVAVPRGSIERVEAIASGGPVIRVAPFRPLTVGVVTTEGMDEKTNARFRASVDQKISWYGASVAGFVDLPAEPEPVAAAIESFIANGADLILTGGGNTIDPLDAAIQALPLAGGELVAFGAPAHPGSMFWLGYRGEVPIFNLASCSMYSKATVADLVLPWVMAGERVTPSDIAALGYGGLLDRDMGFRFPPYDATAADDTTLES